MRRVGIVALIAALSGNVYAQVEIVPIAVSAATTYFANKKVNEILKEFDDSISKFANGTDSTFIHFGNQLQLTVENAKFALNGSLDKVFNDLDKREQKILVELYKIVRELPQQLDKSIEKLAYSCS